MRSPGVSRRVQSVLGCRTCRVVRHSCWLAARPVLDRRLPGWETAGGRPFLASITGWCASSWLGCAGGRSTPPGDGFFATFDGPARHPLRLGNRGGVHALGLSVRAGLHTGEVESSWQRRSAGSPL
jgi:hypothetical protein